MRELVIGSRASRLALWQAGWVRERLQVLGQKARIEVIRTSGDRILDRPLAALGGQGVFVKEIEEALLARSIDLAVHSMKDLPTAQPEGLRIACVPQREDARDLLAAAGGRALAELRAGAVVGTGSPRRACQIRAARPDLEIRDLRGNVDTRIAKLRRGDYEAIILACAGVRRLGVKIEGSILTFEEMLPAVGQGALAIEVRTDDSGITTVLNALNHPPTAAAVTAERALLRGLGGGCQAPIAALGEMQRERLGLRALVADPAGEHILRDQMDGAPEEAEALGLALARRLQSNGADRLLAAAAPPSPGSS